MDRRLVESRDSTSHVARHRYVISHLADIDVGEVVVRPTAR
jgi:hypothetical protein